MDSHPNHFQMQATMWEERMKSHFLPVLHRFMYGTPEGMAVNGTARASVRSFGLQSMSLVNRNALARVWNFCWVADAGICTHQSATSYLSSWLSWAKIAKSRRKQHRPEVLFCIVSWVILAFWLYVFGFALHDLFDWHRSRGDLARRARKRQDGQAPMQTKTPQGICLVSASG
jgi:hypothetical protein